MSQHLSDRQIEKFISRKLPPSDVLMVDDHLAACDICMQKAQANRSTVDLREMLSASTENEHLSYEQMSGFVDNSLTEPEQLIVDVHRRACEECSSEIVNLRKLHDELIAAAPIKDRRWLGGLFAYPFLRIAVPVMGVLILISIVWMWQEKADQPIAEVTPPPIPTPLVGNALRETNNEVSSGPESKRIVASLNDAGGTIEIDDSGNLTGLNAGELSPKVRSALRNQTVDLPSDLRQLRSSAGVLMGGSGKRCPVQDRRPDRTRS